MAFGTGSGTDVVMAQPCRISPSVAARSEARTPGAGRRRERGLDGEAAAVTTLYQMDDLVLWPGDPHDVAYPVTTARLLGPDSAFS
jgi:hypothetical protein